MVGYLAGGSGIGPSAARHAMAVEAQGRPEPPSNLDGICIDGLPLTYLVKHDTSSASTVARLHDWTWSGNIGSQLKNVQWEV